MEKQQIATSGYFKVYGHVYFVNSLSYFKCNHITFVKEK